MIKKIIQSLVNFLGYKISKVNSDYIKPNSFFFPEADDYELNLLKKVKSFTLTDFNSIYYLIQSIKHVYQNDVPGGFVECGVWRGGNIIVFSELNNKLGLKRKIFAYDTFEGMTKPTDLDSDYSGKKAETHLKEQKRIPNDPKNVHCIASLTECKNNVSYNVINYQNDVNFIKGSVEEQLCIKKNLPEKISILRLDTDWYSSTKKELEVLYPRLVKNGILIIDDYGSWNGCKKAVDEFFKNSKETMFQINKNSRIIFKQG